jgi:DNA polymerase-3 subunit chi
VRINLRERDGVFLMIEVAFYHLTRRSLEQVLPVLLERCVARGWQAAVQAASAKRLEQIDDRLWAYKPESFLPHGASAKDADSQPIYLTIDGDNPNGADVRFFVDGARAAPTLADPLTRPRERAVLLFDDAERESAREQWKELLQSGYSLTYWQEDANGKFEKVKEQKA